MQSADEIIDEFPEIELIESESLRRKVVEAWEVALEVGAYDLLREVPGLPMLDVDNVTHTRGVTNIARSIAESMRTTDNIALNLDHITAGAICHDLGKTIEYTDVENGQWINGTWETDRPTVRHSVYGVAITWSLDFPVEVVHIIGSHSKEGQHVISSPEAAVVSVADSVYWEIAIPSETGISKQELLHHRQP